MQKVFVKAMLAAVVAFAGISFNAEAGTQPHKGVIRVKLQPEMALQLGQTPRMQTHGGVVTTGITPLDRASRSVKAMSIRPMLPYAPKFARQRAKYGLDRWYVINFDESVSPDEARKIFASTAGVEHSEVITPMSLKEGGNGFRKLDRTAVPAKAAANMPFNDPFLPKQWHYKNFGDIPYSVAGADINLFEAWKTTTGRKDVVVAIIDGGVDYTHEDLAANMCINYAELNGTPGVDDDGNGYVDDVYGWNFCTNEAKIYPHSHGTHVAGTVAAVNNNGIGVAGVAGGDGTPGSGVKMISCQVFDTRSGTQEGDFAAAIVYAAERGATIAQCSWGWPGIGYYEQAVLDAIDYFTAEAHSDNMTGGLCIFAMGNEGETGDYYPGCYDKVIGVAAMTAELTPASYSCNGPGVDITAPGGLLDYGEAQGVLSTLPGNEYGYNEGTSMATPHVSGVAALVLSKYGSPTFINENLRTQLLTSVNDFYSFGNNKEVEGLFGTGYLDAAKAVNMNQSGAPESVKDFELTAAQDYFVITWTIPDAPDKNVSSHIVYYSTEPFDAGSDISKLPKKVVDTKFFYSGDVCSEEIGGLANLTTYYVAIQAVNRWGNAAPLSPVKTIKTNAGPKITIAESSLDLAATATAPITSGVLTIGNEAEGILKWEAYKRSVSAVLASARPMPGSTGKYKGALAGANAPRAAATVAAEYEANDYPKEISYSGQLWAMIGETDKSLPNSMAQWFKVDPEKYPEGFNLTDLWFDAPAEGTFGADPKIAIYKGDAAISSATLLQNVDYTFFTYNYNIPLNEQLWFAPGESFWVVAHFDAGQEGFPLPMGHSGTTATSSYSFMSNDNGKTWTQLSEALKGSSYESTAQEYVWSVKARSLNPDWSAFLELDPKSGTVKQGETQKVNVKADGSTLVNGNYRFNVNFSTNETGSKITSVPVNLNVDGNEPSLVVPKVVDFGSLLVGQSKTLVVEIFNKGYGSFKGSQWGAGIFSDNIISSSPNFSGPTSVQSGFPARSKVNVELTYTPQAEGSHNGYITFKDKDGREAKILLQGVATEPAKLAVEPSTIDAGKLTLGDDPKELSFSITNAGKYPLEYVFPKFSSEVVEGAANLHKFGYTVASTLEGFNEFAYESAPSLIGATDITSKFTDTQYVTGPIKLGFDFPYYGKTYDQVYITSYGGVMFALNETSFRPPLTPGSYGVPGTGLISAYGSQLQMSPESKVEYALKDGKFVVNFSNVLAVVYDLDYAPVSFHMALSPNGDVEIFYDEYNPDNYFQAGSTLFCGINDPEMTDMVTITSAEMADYWGMDTPTAENGRFKLFGTGTAVKFEAPQASFVRTLEPAYGLVGPGESVEVKATVSVNDQMNAGPTFNNLAIVTNDPAPAISAVRFNALIASDGLNAAVTVDETEIDFGQVFRTSTLAVPVTVKNSGRNTLTINYATFEKGVMGTTNTLPAVVKPGSSLDIMVNIPTDKEGDMADKLTVSTSAGDVDIAISGKVIGCPEATLSFDNVTETVESGAPLSHLLELSNTGNEPMTYAFSPDQLVKIRMPETAETEISYTYGASVDKKATFDWVDIVTNGLGEHNPFRYYNSHDYIEVELPFEFPFYGEKYTKMYIYNTGFISFSERHDDKIWPEPPAEFPNGTVYTNLIAPYWGLHSMNTTKTAGTYHYVTDNRAVVSFMEYGNSMNIGVCFQVILEPDGSFKFQYQAYDDNAIILNAYGLAGVSNADATDAVRLPERFISFGNAVEFTPVHQNTIAPGEKEEIKLDFNTDHLAGVYETALEINTNVPSAEKVSIPVALTITGEAKPVIPESVEVEQVLGFRSTDFSNPIVQQGACYDAPFQVANEGTAAFTLTGVNFESPMIDDEFIGPMAAFMLMAKLPTRDWMTGELTGEYSWQIVEPSFFEPVEIGRKPLEFSIPMMENPLWMTPGVYEVPVQLTYVTAPDSEPVEKTVNVKFTVTPAPAMTLDKEEIRLSGVADNHMSVETLTIGNSGDYKLSYTLRLDPTGVGEEPEDIGGGGIAPTAHARTKAADLNAALKEMSRASFAEKIKPAENDKNPFDVPSDFDYTQALFYDAMPGQTASWNYGANSLYDVFKASVAFKAPKNGINISHLYLPVTIEDQQNVTIKFELIAGDDPEGTDVIGKGSLSIASQANPATGNFYIVPLERPTYLNPEEDFCVVVTYPEGIKYPSYLCTKEEPVTAGRYMAWTESVGWYDVAELFESSNGSLGYILSCLETKPGEPWIKLVSETYEGEIAVGSTSEIKVQVNAGAARMEKGNKAMLVVKSNDPDQSLLNFPIYLDLNGSPVIEAPAARLYAKEGETTNVTIPVSDPDNDDFTVELTDPEGIAAITEVVADASDAGAEITTDENGIVTVKGCTAPVAVKVAIKPDFGQAGTHTFTLAVNDGMGHNVAEPVSYEVEKVNRAPQAIEAEPVEVVVGKLSEVTDFGTLFTDPDGDEMTYTFTLPANDFAEAFTTSTGVVFQGKAVGKTTATVTATDSHGLSATTGLVVSVTESSGIDNVGTDADGLVLVQENPFRDNLRLVCLSAGRFTFDVFDMAGMTIHHNTADVQAADHMSIDLGGAPAGMYILRVTASDGSETHRLIKR